MTTPYRVYEFWSSSTPGTKVRMLAEGDDITAWPKRSDFIRDVTCTPAWVRLADSQWVNIVNHDRAYVSFSKDDAVHEAVKRTEAKLRELNAPPVRNREADRARFPDPEFNAWLDDAVTENGEFTVWNLLRDVSDAWSGWDNGRMVPASEHNEPTHPNHPGHHDGHTCEAAAQIIVDLLGQRAPVSGMPDLASLQRYRPTVDRHHADFPPGPMEQSARGDYVRFADVERLLNAAGETK